MIYILLVFYSLSGTVHMERSEHPSYTMCLRAKERWLADARLDLDQAEAYCVVTQMQLERPR